MQRVLRFIEGSLDPPLSPAAIPASPSPSDREQFLRSIEEAEAACAAVDEDNAGKPVASPSLAY